MNANPAAQVHFFLAQGVLMQGNVTVAGLAIIEGYFKGDLSADTVIVRAGGVIEGSVRADALQVQGRIISQATNAPRPVITLGLQAAALEVSTTDVSAPRVSWPQRAAVPAAAGWQTRVLVQPMVRGASLDWPAQILLKPAEVRHTKPPSVAPLIHRMTATPRKTQELLH